MLLVPDNKVCGRKVGAAAMLSTHILADVVDMCSEEDKLNWTREIPQVPILADENMSSIKLHLKLFNATVTSTILFGLRTVVLTHTQLWGRL